MIITTTSVSELTNYLLEKRAFQFVLIGRMTQDCVENLFSVIRSKNSIPNALQFKNNLKLISIFLYVRPVSRGNYEEDDRDYMTGFLDVINSKMKTKISNPKININTIKMNLEEIPMFTNIEMNVLYNIADYIIHSLQKTSKLCKKCICSVHNTEKKIFCYSRLVRIRCFKKIHYFM